MIYTKLVQASHVVLLQYRLRINLKNLSLLKKLNTVLILEELCDAKQLLNLLDFFAVHGVKATLLTSRLGINIAYPRADLIDVIRNTSLSICR